MRKSDPEDRSGREIVRGCIEMRKNAIPRTGLVGGRLFENFYDVMGMFWLNRLGQRVCVLDNTVVSAIGERKLENWFGKFPTVNLLRPQKGHGVGMEPNDFSVLLVHPDDVVIHTKLSHDIDQMSVAHRHPHQVACEFLAGDDWQHS